MTYANRTLGPGHDEFWDYCASGEFRLQRCIACGEYAWPVVVACEHCGETELPFSRCSGRGKLVSWATFERDYYQGLFPIPWDTILVELEEGPLFISNPKGFTGRDMTWDMAVEVTFVEAADRAGNFMLPVFVKARDRSASIQI